MSKYALPVDSTVSLANDSTDIFVSGANWSLAGIAGGAALRVNGRNVTIASVPASGRPQLALPWSDEDVIEALYEVYPDLDAAAFTATASQFISFAQQMMVSGRLVDQNGQALPADCYIGISVKSFGIVAPPDNPFLYDMYVLGAAPTGGWAGHGGKIAVYTPSGWRLFAPWNGLSAALDGSDVLYRYSGGNWTPFGPTVGDLAAVDAAGVDVTIATPGAAVGGVTMSAGMTFLNFSASSPPGSAAAYGKYVWNGASAAATRATDADTAGKLGGARVFVKGGTYGGKSYRCQQSAADITLGTTALTYVLTADESSESARAQAAEAAEAAARIAGDIVLKASRIGSFARAFCDKYLRTALTVQNDGSILAKQLKAVNFLPTKTTRGSQSITVGTATPNVLRAFCDKYLRTAFSVSKTGVISIRSLAMRTATLQYGGAARDLSGLFDQALGSTLKQSLLKARSELGMMPLNVMASPPTLTLVPETAYPPTAPFTGAQLVNWTSQGTYFRWLYSKYQQYGGNPYGSGVSVSKNGNAGGYTGTNWNAVEFKYTGSKFALYLRAQNQPCRLIVDGKLVSLTPQSFSYSTYGAWHWVVAFASSGTHRIRLEARGDNVFGGIWVSSGDTLSMPSTYEPPLGVLLGDSWTEGSSADFAPGDAFGPALARQWGMNLYGSGLGSTGYVNPGLYVKLRDRSNDYASIASFQFSLWAMGINDSGYSFTDPVGETRDEVKANLDLWFAAHPNAPAIGFSPWWGTNQVSAVGLKMRDGIEQAFSSYGPNAIFVDLMGTTSTGWMFYDTNGGDYWSSGGGHPTSLGHNRVREAVNAAFDRVVATRL